MQTLKFDLEQEEDTQKGKFLIFNLGKDSFGIEIKHVTEIVSIQPITEVPDMPKSIKGIINLRGKIIPVMDIRLRFEKEFKEYDNRTCIIILDLDSPVGIIVDNVSEVLFIDETEIVEPPHVKNGENSFIKNVVKVNDEIKLIINSDLLLNYNDVNILNNKGDIKNEMVL